MAHVSVSINGRNYRMACDDGQEQHLGQLAFEFDQRIKDLRETFGEIGDMRLTVMAALIVADELSEARQRLRRIEDELADAQRAQTTATDEATATHAGLAAAVNAAAARVEEATRLLGQPDTGRDIALG
jgi:cell division protein ZapA